MIPILFPADAETYTTQGLGALSDAISCKVREERNGEFELEMQYPQTGLHFSELTDRCIILAIPSPWRAAQPFRIYRITKPLNGVCTIYARHITYDLSGIPVNVFSAQSAAGALSGLKTNSATANPFEFWTDKQTSAAFSVSVPASIRSLLGGRTGSVLDVYGGEYEWDGWTVRLHEHRGTDRGVTIRYGKNLIDIEQDRNIANVRTGLYPYWTDSDGNLVVCDPPIVNAPGSYGFINIQTVDFSQEWQEAPTPAQLKARAEQYIQANEIGVPTVSISVSFVDLSRTDQYKDLALLEQCDLCDTVTVQFEALGIDATAEVVSIETDVLLERYDKIEVGSLRTNIADTIVDNQQRTDEQIKQTTSYLEDRIQQSTDLITNGGGYIYRKFDAAKNWVEIGSTDNLDLNKAVHVWRWNNGGFGYSGNGYNGPYRAAITQDGHIVADFIDAGTLTANIMRAGILQDVEGKAFYLDLPNGVLRMNATELSIKSSEVATKDYADDAANQARDEAIQSAVDQAEAAFGQELQLYPTKVEMDSAIRQSAGEISSQVNMTLEGYATKDYTDTAEQDAKDFASSAAQDALDQANAETDGKLALYPTTVEMNSAITQTASQITSQVSQTLTQYSTTSESQAYADGVAGDAETAAKQYADQAAGNAESAANAATDNKLKNYSTTVQMNSAIDQKANQITLSVNQTLTRYSTTEESEQYADQAAGQAEDAANAATDNKLKNYSTTVQMNSAIDQKANQITLSVNQTLTRYSTTEESEQYADQAAGQAEDAANAATDTKLNNYSTTSQMNSAIEQRASEILSTVSNTYTTEVQAASAGRNLVSNTAFIGYDPQDSAATIQDGVLTIKPEDSQKRLEFPLDFTPYGIQEIKKISAQNHVTISGEYRIDEKIYYNGSVSRPNYVALEITTESGKTTELKVPDTLILVNVTSGWVSFSEWYNPSLGNITSARLIVVCDRAYQGSISWRNLKVEMGQTATPWSAAPEDVVLQIGYSEELSQQVSEAFDEKLTFYPTSTEMNSAIKQSADSIQLTVDETLTGYVTKDDITLYPTTVQMNSAIEQRANQIELSVEQTLTGYSTTSQMQAAIDLAVDGITLEVSNNGTSSTLILKSGSTVLSSPQINITGFVTFTNLSTSGQTTINAGNLTTGTLAAARINTGTINGSSGNTSWNLGTGDFRSGPSSGTRVQLSASGMRTYADGNLTGVMTHKYGQSAYCCNSVTTCFGWTNSANGPGTGGTHYRPWYGGYDDGTFRGLIYDDTDRSIGIGRYVSLGLQGGSKNKLIVSSFGIIGIESMESPEPTFWDMGSGVCDDAGECLILLDPRFVEAIDRRYRPRWLTTPTDDLGPLWVEKVHLGAVVHGAPGQTFDWAVNAAQQDCAGKYAPEMSGGTRRIEVALIDALDDTDAEGERELLSATAATEEEDQQTALYLLDLEETA